MGLTSFNVNYLLSLSSYLLDLDLNKLFTLEMGYPSSNLYLIKIFMICLYIIQQPIRNLD